MAETSELYQAIISGDAATAESYVKNALEAGEDAQGLLTNHMIPAMDEVGRRFEANEFFVPELLIAARAMEAALGHVQPILADSGAQSAGRVVIGTVEGDLHDIGKNIVASMMKGGGFEVIDLGVNVKADRFVETVKDKDAKIVALSALLTTTMPQMKSVIEAMEAAGVRGQVKVMVGGAPITQEFADQIGADGYSENANGALTLARQLAS